MSGTQALTRKGGPRGLFETLMCFEKVEAWRRRQQLGLIPSSLLLPSLHVALRFLPFILPPVPSFMLPWLPVAVDEKVITASMRSKFPKHLPDSELPTAPLGSLSVGAASANGTAASAVAGGSNGTEPNGGKAEDGASVGGGSDDGGNVGGKEAKRQQGAGEDVLGDDASTSKTGSNGGNSTNHSHNTNTNNDGNGRIASSSSSNGGNASTTKAQKNKKAVRVDRGGGGGHPPAGGEVTEIDYCGILNRVLPPDVRALAWAPVTEGFSARFSCSDRTYR